MEEITIRKNSAPQWTEMEDWGIKTSDDLYKQVDSKIVGL